MHSFVKFGILYLFVAFSSERLQANKQTKIAENQKYSA